LRADYRWIGRADQSGNYQTWLATPVESAVRFNITTPDRRITGNTPTSNGAYFRYQTGTTGFDTTGLSFEEALAQLEALVERLEGGTLSLDDALRDYERGVALSRHCALYLREAEARVEMLARNAAGDDELQPFRLVGPESGSP
jgi:exodeoxyribonuclease VII small subunit